MEEDSTSSSHVARGHLYNLASMVFTAVVPLLSEFGVTYISPRKAALINEGSFRAIK